MPVKFINENQQYTPYIKPYVKGAIDEYANLQKQTIQDYDETQLMYDSLQEAADNMKYIRWKNDDVAKANEIFKNATQQIDEAAKRGDYENLGRTVRKAFKEFKVGYAPLLSNYEADIKKRDELLKFDKIKDPLQRQRVYEKLSRLYNNVPQENIQYNNTGKIVVRPYQDFNAAADVDLVEMADKIINGWKADEQGYFPVKQTNPDGSIMWIQKKTKDAFPNEIRMAALDYLNQNEDVKAFFNQKHIIDRDSYNYEDNQKEISLIKEANPELSDEDAMYFLNKQREIRKAADFAAIKHGYHSSDFDWKFDPSWTAGLDAEAQRKANSQTAIVGSSSTDYKVNLDTLGKIKGDLYKERDLISNKIKNATNPTIIKELKAQQDENNSRIRAQEELFRNIEGQMEFDLEKEYRGFLKSVVENDVTGRTSAFTGKNVLSYNDFKNIVRTSLQGEYTNSVLAGTYGIDIAKKLSNIRFKYNKALNKINEEKGFIQEHDLVVGNENTFSGQYIKNLEKAFQNGQLELLVNGAEQLRVEEHFKDQSLKTISIVPTKGFIAGKPAFAISATDKNEEKKKTYYVTFDERTSNVGAYEQNGYDLIDQSINSKYASAPKQKEDLKNVGLMQLGYSTLIGREIAKLNVPTIQGAKQGSKIPIPDSDGLVLEVFEDSGERYYKVFDSKEKEYLVDIINKKEEFASEESLMRAIGTVKLQKSDNNLFKKIQ